MSPVSKIPQPPSEAEAAAELLRRKNAQGSLHEFLKQAWPVMEPGYEFIDNWHLHALAEHLEAVHRGEIKALLVNVPPRSLKTDLISIAFVAWAWLDRPTEKFVVASYSEPLAEDASIKCRRLVQSRWFKTRWGDKVAIADDRTAKDYWGNTAGGERIITAVDATFTGRGGDCIILDDGNNPRNTSDIVLDNTLHFWTHVVPTRFNDPKRGRIINVQQRVHERDVSGYILSNYPEDYVKFIIPMEFETARRCVTVPLPSTKGKPWRDPRTQEGELLMPKRWDAVGLAQLKKRLGSEYAIAGQLQQRPAPAEGGIIKRAWFQMWKQPEPPECDVVILSIDTAMSEKKAAAYNAATTWGVFRDDRGIPSVILLSMWRERCEYPELRERIQRMSRNYLDDKKEPLKGGGSKRQPDLILIEAKASGLSLIQDLMRAGVTATRFNPDKLGDKTNRVKLITPVLESGRVYVPGKPPDFSKPRDFADQMITQCIMFPAASSRDLVDTMTQALWRLHSTGWIYNAGDPAPQPHYTTEPEGAIY